LLSSNYFMENFFISFLYVSVIVFGVFILNIIVPSKTINGYVMDPKVLQTKKVDSPLKYKTNGFLVYILSIIIFLLFDYYKIKEVTFFYQNIYNCAISSCLIGLLLSYVFYLKGPITKPSNKHSIAPKITKDNLKSGIQMYFFGYELNPRFEVLGLFDIKLYAYLIGAIMTEMILISGLFHQYRNQGEITYTLMTYFILLTWFLAEYLYFEYIHLYTYDFIDENIGFKLLWYFIIS
jgi:hypothetical protein